MPATEVITADEWRRITGVTKHEIGTVITVADLAQLQKQADAAARKQRERELATSLLDQIAAAGLPAPQPEYRFARAVGREWPFDWAYPKIGLAIEIEGGIWAEGRHVRGAGYEGDCEKYSTAAMMGWCVVRVTPAMIEDQHRAIALIRAAYATWRSRRFHPRINALQEILNVTTN